MWPIHFTFPLFIHTFSVPASIFWTLGSVLESVPIIKVSCGCLFWREGGSKRRQRNLGMHGWTATDLPAPGNASLGWHSPLTLWVGGVVLGADGKHTALQLSLTYHITYFHNYCSTGNKTKQCSSESFYNLVWWKEVVCQCLPAVYTKKVD